MKEIKAIVIVKETMSRQVIEALHNRPHFPGLTVSTCRGQGRGKGRGGSWEATDEVLRSATYVKLEVFCSDDQVARSMAA
jgi:nitrogen regulatory protein PII